jgi:hypothetical protein
MNRRPTLPPDDNSDSWESDEVWKLLDHASPQQQASDGFSAQVVRLARQMPEYTPWWKRLFAPAPLTGVAGAFAALALTFTFYQRHATAVKMPLVAVHHTAAQADSLDSIQDVAETETLIVAADHLDDFSDQEIASLIGF